MRMGHFLLWSVVWWSGAMAFAGTGWAAEAKVPAGSDAKSAARSEDGRTDPAWSLMASEQLQARPNGKNRVRYTFPPSTKRM